jgi:hypothetical protein
MTGENSMADIYEKLKAEAIPITDKLSILVQDFLKIRENLESSYPLWEEKDGRLTLFTKLVNTTNSTLIALSTSYGYIEHVFKGVDEKDAKILGHEYFNFVKIGYTHALFSVIESSLRLFMRGLAPTAHNGGTGNFKPLYDDLLVNRLSSPQTDLVKLLDLFRYVRNSIHNNGVFFNSSGVDETVKYNGKNYEFKHGQLIDFVDWYFLLFITDELKSKLVYLVNDANIKNPLSTSFIDPLASISLD